MSGTTRGRDLPPGGRGAAHPLPELPLPELPDLPPWPPESSPISMPLPWSSVVAPVALWVDVERWVAS